MSGALSIQARILSLLHTLTVNSKAHANAFILTIVREEVYLLFINKVNFVVINRIVVLLLFII